MWRAIRHNARQVALAASRVALIDYDARGRDQRRPWVIAFAQVHPWARLATVALLLLVLFAFWLRPKWSADAECRVLRLAALHLCEVLLKLLGAVAAVGLGALTSLAALRRAAIEEAKDAELSEELVASSHVASDDEVLTRCW